MITRVNVETLEDQTRVYSLNGLWYMVKVGYLYLVTPWIWPALFRVQTTRSLVVHVETCERGYPVQRVCTRLRPTNNHSYCH